ncbi:hypothetical protein PRIC1_012473 [Phytophthora ramorum]
MIPCSYAGEVDAEKRRWLLFVRQEDTEEQQGIILTAVVQEGEKNVVAERRVDQEALNEHSEELGLEMEMAEFKTLLVKALEQRSCVDLEVEVAEDETVAEVFLSLTYKFSPTISRKGIFQLPVVAADAPQSLVTLLTSIHAAPPQPILSEQQQKRNLKKKSRDAAAESGAGGLDKQANVTGRQEERGVASALQSLDNGSTTTAVNPMLLKRRHVPTGTMRRKGPRGAKLAKK